MNIANVWYGAGNILWNTDMVEKPLRDPRDLNTKHDLMVLHGGEDISPSIYGQKSIHAHVNSDTPSHRDKLEIKFIERAVELGIPIFGICRGAQLLCAYAGGTLFQHVSKHNSVDHPIVTNSGEMFYTNSMHHQAMRLNKEGIILAKTPKQVATTRFADSKEESTSDEPEVEAAWWPKLNAVGVQGHPEWLAGSTLLVKFSRHIVKEYLRVSIGV